MCAAADRLDGSTNVVFGFDFVCDGFSLVLNSCVVVFVCVVDLNGDVLVDIGVWNADIILLHPIIVMDNTKRVCILSKPLQLLQLFEESIFLCI